ncbi:MAG: hypothetical protein HC838_01585 [Spirulinaceae cyanobacterium RM2_2_10]|nr:hypothetical protein [Spirulinaceae cyanobacterium SM2_1_0]NJO19017.1 hypothetical protein [Spirulinaceae cyanobacterium RM2_2_10]
MLTHHRRPVCLSLISTDLPIWSTLETAATLYQKDRDRFHVLLKAPPFPTTTAASPTKPLADSEREGLLWIELSPARAIATMQGQGQLGYRHFWEQGVYGTSRFWLQGDHLEPYSSLRLRNFTRRVQLTGLPLPESLRVEYELWSEKLRLGCYVLSLEIHH